MLNKEDFITRFTNVCPGSAVLGIDYSSINFDIYFEPLSMAGLEEMHRYSKDVRLYEFFEFDPFDTIEKTRTYIEKLEQRMTVDPLDQTAMYWYIRRKHDGYLIGTAGLTSLSYDRQSIEWGYGVDPELWGQGYILQIEEILKQFVFEILDLNRLHGTTMITNQRTIASLLSSGMKHEGTLRQFYCKNGVFVDGWHYSMLREEYFSTKISRAYTSTKYTVHDVISIISSVLTEEEITHETTMCTAQSWDSLNHLSIMIAVAEKTGISLSPSEMMRSNSVKTLAAVLAERNVTK